MQPPDGATEETFHLLTDVGYGTAYPSVFGRRCCSGEPIALRGSESELSKAMDAARGGQFWETPDRYPNQAWYTLTDECEYECFVGEYIHWGMITLLGFNIDREIASRAKGCYIRQNC